MFGKRAVKNKDKTHAVYVWVIRSDKRKWNLFFDSYFYFAERRSLKNRHFLTAMHDRVKLFGTKDEAEAYYFAKMRCHHDLRGLKVKRKKLHLKNGKYDYWKNYRSFR